jgi:hypothetical protein
MVADDLFMKMGRKNIERRELMFQMKQYRCREKPFDIEIGDSETPYMWWFSLEDNFPKGGDYLVQLALKLFSVTPHAAGCERVWSHFGWIYGKRRTRLGLNKVENMYKLSAYYHANAKKELPYYGVNKSNEEIHQILIDAHLDPDDDLLEIMDDFDDYYDNEKETTIGKEDALSIDNILNLDAFVNREENEVPMQENEEIQGNENDVEWDPATEADKIFESVEL